MRERRFTGALSCSGMRFTAAAAYARAHRGLLAYRAAGNHQFRGTRLRPWSLRDGRRHYSGQGKAWQPMGGRGRIRFPGSSIRRQWSAAGARSTWGYAACGGLGAGADGRAPQASPTGLTCVTAPAFPAEDSRRRELGLDVFHDRPSTVSSRHGARDMPGFFHRMGCFYQLSEFLVN